MMSNSEVSFCVDTLLVQTVLGDDRFYKKAGFIGDLFATIKNYFAAHIDKNHPVESVLKELAPGAIWVFMQSIGLGKWGFFLGLLTDYFHVDILGMLKSMLTKVKDSISSGKQMSSGEIDNASEQVAQETASAGGSPADDHRTYSSLELMDEARFMRLALIEYERQKMRLLKEGADVNYFLGFGDARSKSTSLLAKIIGWIFKIALASAGLMVAGDAVHEVMGDKTPLSGGRGFSSETSSAPPAPVGPVSKQTKFKLKSDSPLSSTWPIVNNQSNIENMVVQFAKDTYDGLDGKENVIKNSPGFKAVVEQIVWYNIHNPGTAVTMIPPLFSSKKRLVDFFIDDVASAST